MAILTDFKSKLQQAIAGKKSSRPSVNSVYKTAKAVTIAKKEYVFGVNWQFYGSSKDLRSLMSAARNSGVFHYATTVAQEMVGFVQGVDKLKSGKKYSAALHLAETRSQGGVELFVLKLGEDLYSITALHDSLPVEGFDQLGTRSEILSLTGEFQLQQFGKETRHLGNAGILENEESISLIPIFSEPAQSALIKKIPDIRLLMIVGLGLILSGLLFYLVWSWINNVQVREANERRAREQDPNFIYENAVPSAMAALKTHGQAQLEQWRATIEQLPLSHKGWELKKIDCVPDQCEATWERSSGNYADFYSEKLPGINSTEDFLSEDNPSQAEIKTISRFNEQSRQVKTPSRESLLSLTERRQLLASQMQDMALLANSTVQMKQPALYPAVQGINANEIQKPLVKGDWAITHEMWSLADLELKGNGLTVSKLLLFKQDQTNAWLYTLMGNYYAKGKEF
jgi:hypothetical protein